MSEEKEEVFEEKEEREEEEVFEEKEEKREERPDTLSGLLQSIIPLMIIPQILPLFQQSLSQTLRETTLNVKVESSMAIIPIDIAAQTAVVAVDIRSQSVTLNVRIEGDAKVSIVGQSVTLSVGIERSITLGVRIEGSEAVIPIDVRSQSTMLNVNIAEVGSGVVFNVSIVSSPATLNVNITGSTATLNVSIMNAYLDVRIIASTATLNVSITSSVTLNVNIASQTTTLNVNIAGQTTTLNVNVTGRADVRITAQTAGIYLSGTYGTLTGTSVNLTGFSRLEPFRERDVAVWTPGPGDVYFIEGVSACYEVLKDSLFRPDLVVVRIYVGTQVVSALTLNAEKPSDSLTLIRAIRVTSANPLSITAICMSPVCVNVRVMAYMYGVT